MTENTKTSLIIALTIIIVALTVTLICVLEEYHNLAEAYNFLLGRWCAK